MGVSALGWAVGPALAGALGQAPPFAASVEVAVARREVRVLDERHCIAEVVRPEDVRVRAGARTLDARVGRDDGPLRLLLVLDASASMDGRRIVIARRLARSILERLASERRPNEAALAGFDERLYWLAPGGFTRELCGLATRLEDLPANGVTALWRALDEALDSIELDPSALPTAIVVISDGQDNCDRSRNVYQSVRRRAAGLRVPIFAVALPPKQHLALLDEGWEQRDEVRCSHEAWEPGALDAGRELLRRACRTSGGALYTPRETADVGRLGGFLLAQIRAVHWVEAELPAEVAGASLPLVVEAGRPGLRVLASRAPGP